MTTYDTLVFDVDGTLLDVTPLGRERYFASIEEVLEEVGIPRHDVDPDWFLGRTDEAAVRKCCQRHGVDFASFWRTKEHREVELQRRAFENGRLRAYDDIIVLPELAERVPLGVVSDNQQAFVEQFLKLTELSDHVSYVDARSCEPAGLQRRKPNPKRLNRAIRTLNADSDDALYVGDHAIDVETADGLGVDSALIRRDQTDLDRSSLEGVIHVIDSLADLCDFV